MKKSTAFILMAIIIITIVACSKKSGTTNGQVNPVNLNSLLDSASYGLDSPFISKDSANKMISSYLASVNNTTYEDDVHSYTIDAQALRYYLNNTNIKHVKIMLAHRLDYINNGGEDNYAGNRYDAMTLVIAGYDQNSNYVYTTSNMVLDHATACPYECPGSGTAAYDLLQ